MTNFQFDKTVSVFARRLRGLSSKSHLMKAYISILSHYKSDKSPATKTVDVGDYRVTIRVSEDDHTQMKLSIQKISEEIACINHLDIPLYSPTGYLSTIHRACVVHGDITDEEKEVLRSDTVVNELYRYLDKVMSQRILEPACFKSLPVLVINGLLESDFLEVKVKIIRKDTGKEEVLMITLSQDLHLNIENLTDLKSREYDLLLATYGISTHYPDTLRERLVHLASLVSSFEFKKYPEIKTSGFSLRGIGAEKKRLYRNYVVAVAMIDALRNTGLDRKLNEISKYGSSSLLDVFYDYLYQLNRVEYGEIYYLIEYELLKHPLVADWLNWLIDWSHQTESTIIKYNGGLVELKGWMRDRPGDFHYIALHLYHQGQFSYIGRMEDIIHNRYPRLNEILDQWRSDVCAELLPSHPLYHQQGSPIDSSMKVHDLLPLWWVYKHSTIKEHTFDHFKHTLHDKLPDVMVVTLPSAEVATMLLLEFGEVSVTTEESHRKMSVKEAYDLFIIEKKGTY